jgi:hypothetical protein
MTRMGRKLGIAVLVLLAVLGPAAAARAGRYTVHACGSGDNNTFFGATSDSRMAARSLCAADGEGHRLGIGVLAGVSQGQVPVFANATQTFLAPPGTAIAHVHLKADARTSNGDWAALLQASTDRFSSGFWNVAGCLPRAGDSAGCTAASPQADQNYDVPGATGFRSTVACGNFAGCGTFTTGTWPFARAYYLIHQADVTLDDSSVPAVTVIGGGLAETGWVRGSQRIVYEAGDNSGVTRTQFVVDDTVLDHFEHPCDFAFAVPCANVNDATYLLDTSSIADGPHRITVAAFDATDVNRGTAARTVLIDNHAPREPLGAAVAGGEGWHTNDDFTVTWTNPASAAPITRALYEICRVGGSCVSGEQSAEGISQLSGLHVGQPGDYTIRIWLADAAGNVSDAKSAPLYLKFDNVAPGSGQPRPHAGWINDAAAKRVDLAIDPNAGVPASGIAGYAVTLDGSNPGSAFTVPASAEEGYIGRTILTELAEGTAPVRVRAISGAGVPSPDVGQTELHVDRTAPQLAADGAPGEDHWSRTPITVRVTANDALSGMASAAGAGGGYVETRIDEAERHRSWGPTGEPAPDGRLPALPTATADVVIADDGMHHLAFRAADAAGNTAAERALTVRIDRTPPELAVFEDQRASDPRLIDVAASDRTSGLGDGAEIRLRRVTPTQGPWVALATARNGNHYYAHVQNAALVAGEYEFAATVPDQAGNEAVATTNRDGRAKVVYISPTQVGPYETPPDGGEPPRSDAPGGQDATAAVATRITAAAVDRQVVRKKCKRPRRGARKRCPRPTVREVLVHDLRLGFGKKGLVRGRLTSTSGAQLARTEITVLARPAMAGGVYRATAVVKTGVDGRFSYKVPGGSSRTLDFEFRGDRKYKQADEQITFRVPAAATIRASRHTVRNGKSVAFSGRLSGKPYPARGKVLDLQAFYRKRWRTFATPRASKNGRWSYKYRFGATRGVVLYKFRLHVRATSDYPYEPGYSKTTKVRVRG